MLVLEDCERRRFERFCAPQYTYAVVRYRKPIIGEVSDLSFQGLSLRYMAEGRTVDIGATLDLFSSAARFLIREIPFSPVADILLTHEPSFIGIRVHRLGVRFQDLTPAQKAQLQTFIEQDPPAS